MKPKRDYVEVVNSLFNKEYHFLKDDSYYLPEPSSIFTATPWQIDKLQELKTDLNNVKSQLNDYKLNVWHEYTNQRNKAGEVHRKLLRNIRPELLTQAWCKFYENVSSFSVVPSCVDVRQKFTSVHLCEAPGAFITSLNHWLKTNKPMVYWDWIAMSLNPYSEANCIKNTIKDDRFIIHTLNKWYFGDDDTGNIMNLKNIEGLAKMTRSKGDVLLVTADGSIDCTHDPGEQEVIVSHLHFCEAVAALRILEDQGTLILKIFTTFEHQTVCLIYLLTNLFDEVHFKKPATSKEGNSETYVICLGFKGSTLASPYLEKLKNYIEIEPETAMFKLEDLPEHFINQMIECSRYFKEYQCSVIMDNIKTFQTNDAANDLSVKHIRDLVAKEYIRRYNLKRIPDYDRVVCESARSKIKRDDFKRIYVEESYNEICQKKSMNLYDQLERIVKRIQTIEFTAEKFTHEFNDELCELSIKQGKPLERIRNSIFCDSKLLQSFQELIDVTDKLDMQIPSLPFDESINSYKKEINDNESSCCHFIHFFDYMSKQSNWSTFTQILKKFDEIMEGHCLVILGYCLLTRFNVGLIYILSHTFKSVEFRLNEAMGCVIFLRHKKTVENVNKNLCYISNIIKKAQSTHLSIVSLVPITELFDHNFYHAIVESNTWNITFCAASSIAVLKTLKPHDKI